MIDYLSVISTIQKLEQEYQASKGLILSESDLKCHLFKEFYSLILDHRVQTYDADCFGSPLHTEIKFFDETRSLSLIPDITILNPKELSVFHSLEYEIRKEGVFYRHLSGKEFSFTGESVIFELKFSKLNSGINEALLKKFITDIEKIKRLQSIGRNSGSPNKIIGYFILFCKYEPSELFLSRLRGFASTELHILLGTSGLPSKKRMRKKVFE